MNKPSKASMLREFFKNNSPATQGEALEALKDKGFDSSIIKTYICRGKKCGYYSIEDGYITYIDPDEVQEKINIVNEWKREIRTEWVETLTVAGKNTNDLELLRKMAKTVHQLLGEI